MSRASTNSGSNNLFSDTIGVAVFKHSAHIRFLSTTFPFITVMQAYSKSHEMEVLVSIGEIINLFQHLAFVLNPHFDAVWGYILGGPVSQTVFTSHLPLYDLQYDTNSNVLAAFYGLVITYLAFATAIVATHIIIGIMAANTDRYSSALVTFNRLVLRSFSSWLWIPFVQAVIAPLVCIDATGTGGATEHLIWYFAYYSDSSSRHLGECRGGNHIALIVLSALTITMGVPLFFMARWCEYVSRSDSSHLRSRRHWYADIADFVHSAVICILFQTLIAHGMHGAFALVLTITSTLMACLYIFFLPFYDHRMNGWYVMVHVLTAFISVLACVTYFNDNWYTMMLSPVLLLGMIPFLVVFVFLLRDLRVNPRFQRALGLCRVDGKLFSIRLVPYKAMAMEDEMIDTIVPLPSPHRHIPIGSTVHRMRFAEGLQDETLAAFAPFDDFDDRVRVAIIGKQSYMRGGGRRSSAAVRGNGDDDDDDNFFSGTVGVNSNHGASRAGVFDVNSSDDEGNRSGQRPKQRRRMYAKRFSRLLVPFISKIWCPSDVELSTSYVCQCIRLLHRNPSKSMSLLAMHTFARGIVKYPHSVFLKLQFGSFIAEHLPNFSQFGMALTNSLQHFDNTFSDEFRGIQLKQAFRQALSMRSQSDAMHTRNALAQHREVLSNMQRFWGLLMEPTVSIQLVSAEADLITFNRKLALQHFRRAIQHLSLSNWPLIANTGDFLHNVLLDEEGALECYKEARELHEARLAGQMKGSRLVTFVMPDVETLSQRLLALLSTRTKRRGIMSGGEGSSVASSSARGVVQHLMAVLSAAFVVLLIVGGVLFFIAIDERKYELLALEEVTSIGRARAAAVEFVSSVYALEGKTLSERNAMAPKLASLADVFGDGVRTMSSNTVFSKSNPISLLDSPAIPWSFTPITSVYLPFDGSAKSLTTVKTSVLRRVDQGSNAVAAKESSERGGTTLRSMMELMRSAMQTVLFYNASAQTPYQNPLIPNPTGSPNDYLLNDFIDNELLFLKEGANVMGVAMTYQVDVLARHQEERLRDALILITCIFVLGLLTLLLLRAVVYVSLKRSSLERVFTFQLMTLIPFDALERLATETREKKDSIRRFQGGGLMERRNSVEGSSGSSPTSMRISPSSPTTVTPPTMPVSGGGILPEALLPSAGDVFGPPSAATNQRPAHLNDPILANLERSMNSAKVNAERSTTVPAHQHHQHNNPYATTNANTPGTSNMLLMSVNYAQPATTTSAAAASTNTHGPLSTNSGGSVRPISTTMRSGRGGHDGDGAKGGGGDAHGGGDAVNITVLPSKVPQAVPLKSALRTRKGPQAGGVAFSGGFGGGMGAAAGQRRIGGAQSGPLGGGGGGAGTTFSGGGAAVNTAVVHHGANHAPSVKRVTFAVNTRRARRYNGDSNLIYSSLSGRRIVSGAGMGHRGGGIGMSAIDETHIEDGYAGISYEKMKLLHGRASSFLSSLSANSSKGAIFPRILRKLRLFFGPASKAMLLFAILTSNLLFVVGTVFAGLALEKVIAVPEIKRVVREESNMFTSTNKSWVDEDMTGARFIGAGIAEDISSFLSSSYAVTSTIPLFLNMRLNDKEETFTESLGVMASRATSVNLFSVGSTGEKRGGGGVSTTASIASTTRDEDFSAIGSLASGPSSFDAVGLLVQVEKAHTAQMDAKRDAIAIAAIGHGVSISEYQSVESRRADPKLLRRAWERQRSIYEHAQVLFMSSFIASSKGLAPLPIDHVEARTSNNKTIKILTSPDVIVTTNRTTFEEFLRITAPNANPYTMPVDFLLLLSGMLYADMCGHSVDSRKLLSRVFDGRLKAAEDRISRAAPRNMNIACLLCFAIGICLLLMCLWCPVYEWTAYSLRRKYVLLLCFLGMIPLIISAVIVANTNIAKHYAESYMEVIYVSQDVQDVYTNTLYQSLYVISSLDRFWSMYDMCRCHIYGTVIRLTLRNDVREAYISQNGATDLFVSARVMKLLQNIANSLTTTTMLRSSVNDVVPTTSLNASNISSSITADFYNEYDRYASAVNGLGSVSSLAVHRELNRSLEDLFWDVEAEVGQHTLSSYFPEEFSSHRPTRYYTNSTYDLERRTPMSQRQLAIKITFGDRYNKAIQRIADITDGALHRSLMDLKSQTEQAQSYSFKMILACLCTCSIPLLGVAFVMLKLVGTAYSFMGLTTRNSSNKLDSSSSQQIAARAQWSLLVIAILLAVPFGVGVWTLMRDSTLFNKGVSVQAFEFERLKSLLALRELTTGSSGIVMGTHSVDHSKMGLRVLDPDIAVFTDAFRSSLRAFLFGNVGDNEFYALGVTETLDKVLIGDDDVDEATLMAQALARDTCDKVINSATANRVQTMARLVASTVESGGTTSASTMASLKKVYAEHGLRISTNILLQMYQQWSEQLVVVELASKGMSHFGDRRNAMTAALVPLDALDASIKDVFKTAEDTLAAYFRGIIDEGFTLFVLFTGIFVLVVIAVYIFAVIPLVQNLLEEAENARLLLRMIPSAVREKVPAIVQYIDTGKIDNAAELQKKFDASEKLLQNILPTNIATRLKAGEVPIADMHESLTILFTDLVGFTKRSTTMPAAEIVDFLNEIFQQFDTVVEMLALEKIKTIGDAYFMAGGLDKRITDHELRVVEAGLLFHAALTEHNDHHPSRIPLQMRVGIHTGPAVAGVIGTRKVAYELWGDSVAIANAMETTGVPGFVHISQTTASKVQDYFILQPRGPLPKEKETVPDHMPNTYLVVGRRIPTPYQHIIRPRLSRNELV